MTDRDLLVLIAKGVATLLDYRAMQELRAGNTSGYKACRIGVQRIDEALADGFADESEEKK